VSFFFQAEDGIRDDLVTGVQTCALPISLTQQYLEPPRRGSQVVRQRSAKPLFASSILARASFPCLALWRWSSPPPARPGSAAPRSEERRVGKECSSRRAT